MQAERRLAWTRSGEEVPYDVLVVATGAKPEEAVPGAFTFRGTDDQHEYRTLMDESRPMELSRAIAFAVPSGTTWSLPIYELALITAARLRARRERRGA